MKQSCKNNLVCPKQCKTFFLFVKQKVSSSDSCLRFSPELGAPRPIPWENGHQEQSTTYQEQVEEQEERKQVINFTQQLQFLLLMCGFRYCNSTTPDVKAKPGGTCTYLLPQIQVAHKFIKWDTQIVRRANTSNWPDDLSNITVLLHTL